MSASLKTTTGELAPSSSESFLTPAILVMDSPTLVEPVKDIFLTFGLVTRASPKSAPGPVITLRTPSGKPASMKHWANAIAVSGVVLAGFKITALPTASAGPILCITKSAG